MKVGFFGKLPGYGDFVQRNVNPAIVDYWDNWILQAIDNSKSELKKQWKDRFFTSPIWRFHIHGGIVCDDAISGLMMPSVDSLGRCYPFFVICRFESKTDVFTLASIIDKAHAKCEEFLLHLLDQSRPNLDEVSSEIGQFYNPLKRHYIPKIADNETLAHNQIFQFNGKSEEEFSHINQRFLSFMAEQQDLSMTIWSRAQSQHLTPQYRYYKGMPPTYAFSSFLGEPN